MINIIANRLAEALALMPMADKVTGLVKAARVLISENELRSFPIAYNTDPTQCQPSELIDFCPDDSKASIIYLEDLGTEVIDSDDRGYRLAGSLRLVCWFNYRRLCGSPLGKGMYEPSLVAMNVLKYLPGDLGNLGGLVGARVEVVRQEPSDPAIFARYTYIEEASQYLTYPYDAISFLLRAEWRVLPQCIDDLIQSPGPC